MNPVNPEHKLPDVADVYFTDGVVLGPSIAMRDVGPELPELILRAFEQLKQQELWPPTMGVATSALIYQAVGSGNHVSTNPPPNRVNFGAQLAWLFQREHSLGGIGCVIINLNDATITTYGGRGFPEIKPSNQYMQSTFSIDELDTGKPSGIEAASAPVKRNAAKPKKKAARKKGAKKKAAAKKEVEEDFEISV